MAKQDNLTTLVCLFHHEDQAQAAQNDLLKAGISQSSISLIGGPAATKDALEKSELSSLGMPDKDYDHLKQGVRNGGTVLAVSSLSDHVGKVEKIFSTHRAEKIDEADAEYRDTAADFGQTGETTIPIVEEELLVGKRTVDEGGVRVYRRIVEIPVDESVQLREEHVNIDRRAVDRAATDGDLAFGDRTIELTETAEEAVISKNARVVEEVLVGKDATEHTETINDTVRRTEVEVEEVPAANTSRPRGY